jgi:hypothetical protein
MTGRSWDHHHSVGQRPLSRARGLQIDLVRAGAARGLGRLGPASGTGTEVEFRDRHPSERQFATVNSELATLHRARPHQSRISWTRKRAESNRSSLAGWTCVGPGSRFFKTAHLLDRAGLSRILAVVGKTRALRASCAAALGFANCRQNGSSVANAARASPDRKLSGRPLREAARWRAAAGNLAVHRPPRASALAGAATGAAGIPRRSRRQVVQRRVAPRGGRAELLPACARPPRRHAPVLAAEGAEPRSASSRAVGADPGSAAAEMTDRFNIQRPTVGGRSGALAQTTRLFGDPVPARAPRPRSLSRQRQPPG